ncbi:aldo/keto reductase [Thiospirochaeta perfilievii]|uniref:Aldo/keto reductase n=1 Tax=Thiospirochaeta perfilievii TaxID=252967 RepID=A0A5C1Q9C2_9SPIO|nr:aldo/keto reductase [Thiospirochaeta perfilievii]QEN04733.1 aldo/keto reductase [Thiospirochaeta perfilievii]
MLYKMYGKTGKRVSAVGFGGMRFDETKTIEENAEIVRYASSKGINYFDTAPGYCSDTSEDIFGEAFKNMPNPFYVSTKGMPTTYDTAEKAIDAVKKSIKRMGLKKIDFYHIWCIRKSEHYELAMKPGGQYEGLLQCQKEGLIDHIVLSSHQNGNEVKEILIDKKIDGILLGVNILNFPYRWEAVETAYNMGYGVVAMNPLSGGAIPTHEKELQFLTNGKETATEAALRFVISCPQITIALNGFTTKEHIDTACKIANESKPFEQDEIKRIENLVGESMNEACTGCGYCDKCPQGIAIPSFLQYYNEKHVFHKSDKEMKENIVGAYEWGILAGKKGTAADCTSCGLCEDECTQHLPIIDRLKEITSWT